MAMFLLGWALVGPFESTDSKVGEEARKKNVEKHATSSSLSDG